MEPLKFLRHDISRLNRDILDIIEMPLADRKSQDFITSQVEKPSILKTSTGIQNAGVCIQTAMLFYEVFSGEITSLPLYVPQVGQTR